MLSNNANRVSTRSLTLDHLRSWLSRILCNGVAFIRTALKPTIKCLNGIRFQLKRLELILMKSGRNNRRWSTRASTSTACLVHKDTMVDDPSISNVNSYETQERLFHFDIAIDIAAELFQVSLYSLQNQAREIRWWNRRPAEAAVTQTNPFVHSSWHSWTQPISISRPMPKLW